MLKQILISVLALTALFALTGCSEDTNPLMTSSGDAEADKVERIDRDERRTVADLVLRVNRDSGEFSTLLAAVETAGLVESLFGKAQRTVFAPTDEAFAAIGLDADSVRDLDREALTDILGFHMTDGRLAAADVLERKQINMFNDRLTLISLKESGAYIENSRIISTDIVATNGIIHIIDSVLLPAQTTTRNRFPEITQARPGQPSLIDVALSVNAQTGEFSTLIAAIIRADLVGALSGRGQFTVFAPTDAAFAELGLNADNIASVAVADLKEILLFHVTSGSKPAGKVLEFNQLRMLNSQFAEVSIDRGSAFIDKARIIRTDVKAANGVIHLIDTVILPAQESAGPGVSLDRTSSF
jgi:transforming growth factor-beta-induced protein